MTNSELNRDIKRLKAAISKEQSKITQDNNEAYFKFIEDKAKPEFLRLYRADQEFTAINLQSIKIMLRLNVRFRIVPFHQFGLMIKD